MSVAGLVSIDSEGGQIGHLGWVNSCTMGSGNANVGVTPIRWWGSVTWLNDWPILDHIDD